MDRVFLDANILFPAAYRPEAGLRRLWNLAEVELLTSTYAVEEARHNLDTAQQRADLEHLLARGVMLVPEAEGATLPATLDLAVKDRPILAAAIAAKATHLLTGDVRHFEQYYGQTIEGVLILRPAVYLKKAA